LQQRWCSDVNNSLSVFLTDETGLIARDTPVTLTNVSRGGCLLESVFAVAPGSIAVLRVEIQGRVYSDAIRVTRCGIVPGAGERHHIGAEFLQLTVPDPLSLRMYAALVTQPLEGGAWAVRLEMN
jgi:hypothetical protein